MKRAIIIHGWGGYPGEGWQKWLREELEKKGWKVEAPEMPNTEKPEINSWVSKLQEISKRVNKETFFVGHSIGCQTIMRYLENLEKKIKIGGVVFVAPWFNLLETAYGQEEEKDIAKPWLTKKIDLEKVKEKCGKVVAVFSDNDSCVPLTDKEIFKEKLNAEIIVEHEKGHFSGSDNISELSIVLEKLMEMAK